MENTHESWKDITDFEGYYQVSNQGRVKSLERVVERSNGRIQTFKERILKPSDNGNGYLTVMLSKDGKQKRHSVHTLIKRTFEPIDDYYKYDVGHLDDDKTNNRIENLSYQTHKENCNYGIRNQKLSKARKGKFNNKKMSKQVCQIDKDTNEIIAVFPSTNEIQRKLGFCTSGISMCCNGKFKTMYGYRWKYC